MKALSADALRQYHDTGYYAPVPALSTAEAAALRRKLETHEAAHGKLTGHQRHKTHLLFTWLDELIRHPKILDAVEDVIGPDILCWGTSFFHQGAPEPRVRVVAPGQHVLGVGPRGHRDRLGGAV